MANEVFELGCFVAAVFLEQITQSDGERREQVDGGLLSENISRRAVRGHVDPDDRREVASSRRQLLPSDTTLSPASPRAARAER